MREMRQNIHADWHGAINMPVDLRENLERSRYILHKSDTIIFDPLKAGPLGFNQFEVLWANSKGPEHEMRRADHLPTPASLQY